MKANRYTYIIITIILLLGFFSSYAQRGLKKVYLPEGLTACASQDFNSFELTIEWTPPIPTADNVYTVELSNAQGDFSNPIRLAEIKQSNSTPKFTYSLKLPKDVRGDGYRIRVTSSNPFSQKETKPFSAYYISYKKRLILNNKESNVTLCPGDTKVLSVTNTDLPKNNIAYRWFKNDNLIPGVSGSSYEVSEAGVYQVEVDYGKGYCSRSADTKSNKVTVRGQGTTDLKLNEGITEKYICKGKSFELVASKKESNLKYFWYREGNPNPVASGEGVYTYTTPTGADAAGRYYVKIGDGSSTCQERSNILEVRIRQEFEVTTKIEDGSNVILPGVEKKLVASTVGAENPTYQWYKNGDKIDGATGKEYIAELEGSYFVKVTDSGRCIVDKDSAPLELVYPESFQAKIMRKSYYADCKTDRVVIGITDLKAGIGSRKEDIPQSSYADLKYKWEKDGVLVSGETNPDIILDNPTQNGTYKAYVSYSGISSTGTNSLLVMLVNSDNNLVLEASYTPSDGGGVVHLCKNFTERLEVKGNAPASSNFIWYKNDTIINGATGRTYDATKIGNYRVEVSGGATCPVVTNNLLLQNINISVGFLNNFGYHTSSNNDPVILLLPYKEINLRTSIVGIDPGKIKISWYKNGQPILSADSANYKVSDPGDYYCKVTPSLNCASYRTSKTVKVVSPKTYHLEIDYKSGKEACNDAQEVVLELVSLKGIAQVATETIEIDIPEDDYPRYQFQWYKGNELLSGQTSTTLTVPAEQVGGASTISDYTLEMTYSGGTPVKSNSKRAGVEKLKTTVVLDDSSVGYSPQENEVFVCEGETVDLKAKTESNSPSATYQWLKGGHPISGANSPTVSVTEEGGYSVRVSGEICKNILSENIYNVRFFKRDQVKFYLRDADKVLDLSKKITFIAGESVQIRVEGAKDYSGYDENGIADDKIIETNGNIITIKKGGKFRIKADIGDDSCAAFFNLEVEEIPLPSKVPSVVMPGGANNRYWNLPSEYMQKENVKVSIYTQDGVEVLSTTNFQNDSWPTDFNVESTGRAVIYLYIIEVDGVVKERGTITLFQ